MRFINHAYIRSVPERVRAWPIWTWPNFLSVVRMLAVFPLWWILQWQRYEIAIWVYVGAMITDYFDGYTARKYNQITNFGKLLDPLADKVLHIFLLREFQFLHPEISPQYSIIWKLAIVLAVLPSFAYVLDKQRRLGSNIFGKWKLFVEVLALGALFMAHIPWCLAYFSNFVDVAGVLLWAAAALAGGSILGHMFIKEGFDYRWWRKRAKT